MKRILGLFSIIILAAFTAEEQTFKFGHIHSDELIHAMPDFHSATVKI